MLRKKSQTVIEHNSHSYTNWHRKSVKHNVSVWQDINGLCWVSTLAYPNLLEELKGFVDVDVDVDQCDKIHDSPHLFVLS